MNAPLDPNYHDKQGIDPYLNMGSWEILFSPYNRFISIYRAVFTNGLISILGVSEVVYRTFPSVLSLATLFFIYRFTEKEIGGKEALVALFLFGISHYSLWTIHTSHYGAFYMLASFLAFYFLWNGFNENLWRDWIGFGVINFLNLTNSIIAGNFVVPTLSVALILSFLQAQKGGSSSIDNRRKIGRFAVAFSVSLMMVMILYYLRGFNFPLQIYNVVFLHQTGGIDNVFKAGDYIKAIPFTVLLPKLLYAVFVTFNFEYGDGSQILGGSPRGYWSYLCLFVIGLWAFLKKNKKLFICFSGVFITATILSAIIFKVIEARYLAFILPFYLITVAVGFVHVLNLFIKKAASNWIVYLSAFLFFSWLIQPSFLFSATAIDEQFHTEGIRGISIYLKKNINPGDIVLNATLGTELRTEYGDALNLVTYGRYLESFKSEHRLELLPDRKGEVGIWLILTKSLDNEKMLPFYFPGNYRPRIVKSVHGMNLYYGKIDLPESDDIGKDLVFTTPFWSFMKAYNLQIRGQNQLAEEYYRKFMEYGLNLDRALFNLGLMYVSSDVEKAISYFTKAIEELETPTQIPPDAKIESWDTYFANARGFPDPSIRSHSTRYFMVEESGVKTKRWIKEDLIKADPIYSKYFLATGKTFYGLYKQTDNPQYFEKALGYFAKGSHMTKKVAESLRVSKDKSYPTDIPVNSYLLDLNGVHELFPPLLKAEQEKTSQVR